MAVTFADLTVDPQTLVDADPTSPVRIIVRTNTGGAIIDSAANKIFLGTYSVDTETTATISLPVTNGATNPTDFQYAVDLEYVDAATRTRKTWSSGWFSFTAAANLASIAAEQYVPPTWMTTAVATLQAKIDEGQALLDAQEEISGLTGEDAAVGALIEGTAGAGPITRAALSASFVGPRGKTTTGPAASLPYLNVKDYGAAGDNATDDTAAIQAAFDASNAAIAFSSSRPWVMFPPGVYRISSTVSTPVPFMRGEFPNSSVRILWDGPEGGDAFEATTATSYNNYAAVQGINFRKGTAKPGRWVKFNNGIDSMFILNRVVFADFTIAGIEVNDFINFFATDMRFDPYSGYGIVINESNGIGTKSFTLDRFTIDMGGDNGAAELQCGLLKSAGDNVRRGNYRIANGRVEVNGPMAEPKALVLVEGLSASRDGYVSFDTVEVEAAAYGTDFAWLRYLPGAGGGAQLGPNVTFINCRTSGATYWVRDQYEAGSLRTADALGPLLTAPSTAQTTLSAMTVIGATHLSTEARLRLSKPTANTKAGGGFDIENTGLQTDFYSIADLLTPGTRIRAIAVRHSTGNLRFGGTASPTTDKVTVDGNVVALASSSTNEAFGASTTASAARRLSVNASGKMSWGDGTNAVDTTLYRDAADRLKTDDKFVAGLGIGVGNSVAATTPGTVVRKMEVFDASGTSLGFVPIYDAIT